MRALRIDFAARRRPAAVALAALAAGLALLLVGLYDYRLAGERLAAADAAVAASRATLEQRPSLPRELSSPLSAREVESINRAITQLNLPWGEMLGVFEERASDDVALLAIEPDGKRRLLKLQAEARHARAMLDFIAALRQHPAIAEVTPVHHEVLEGDPQRPYRFALEARWKDRP